MKKSHFTFLFLLLPFVFNSCNNAPKLRSAIGVKPLAEDTIRDQADRIQSPPDHDVIKPLVDSTVRAYIVKLSVRLNKVERNMRITEGQYQNVLYSYSAGYATSSDLYTASETMKDNYNDAWKSVQEHSPEGMPVKIANQVDSVFSDLSMGYYLKTEMYEEFMKAFDEPNGYYKHMNVAKQKGAPAKLFITLGMTDLRELERSVKHKRSQK